MAENPFGEGGASYAGDMMTLRGPASQRQRRRLQPGMRLADGTIWTGDTKIAGLEKHAESLRGQIAALEEELAKTEAKIGAAKEAVDDASLVAGRSSKKQTTKKKVVKEDADVNPPAGEQFHVESEPEG